MAEEMARAGTHNEISAAPNGDVVQVGNVFGSVYLGGASPSHGAVQRTFEATSRRLDEVERQLAQRPAHTRAESVQVDFHPIDRAWATWIADTVSKAGYVPLPTDVTAGAGYLSTKVIAVISPDYLATRPAGQPPSEMLAVMIREADPDQVPHDHLPLVGISAERAHNLLLTHLGVDQSNGPQRHSVPPPSLRVRDVADPVLLGVHPSPMGASKVPPYVARDAEAELAHGLHGNAFVVIIGDATVGKTRLAYEFARARLSEHWLVAPRDADGLATALRQADMVRKCVVWLDDLERFLSPRGLIIDELSTLLRRPYGHVVVLCTMRGKEHAKLSPRWESQADEPGRCYGQDVLRLAREIRLDRHWSAAERSRAVETTDARLREAAHQDGAFGPAEYLAAGPRLLAEWHDAWSAGVRPRGAALVAAAIDACRAGMHRGVGISLLRRLHGHYLDKRGGAALRPESFADALAWAVEPTDGTSALLMPSGPRRFQVFGYLLDATDSDIPATTWRTLIAHATTSDCWHIGQAAYAKRELRFAETAFRRAAADNPAAEIRIADCVGESGRRRDALAALRIAVEDRRRRLSPHHPDLLDAMRALAGWTGRVGDLRGAVELFEQIAAARSAERGTIDRDTLAARHDLANWRGRAGDLNRAITEYEEVVQDWLLISGPDDPDTLAARHDLANWMGRAGDIRPALREHQDVTEARSRVLGPDHADTLRSGHRTARLTCEALGSEVGLPLLAKVVLDRTRVLGLDHPDTLRSRAQFARWTGRGGLATEAARLYGLLAQDSARVLGARHPDTLRRRHQQARWTGETGNHDRATALFSRVIDDWTELLGFQHPYTLISRYRLAENLHRAGDRSTAIDLLVAVATDDTALLGAGHPYTARARSLLTQWRAQPPE
jgi:tetratricopeptide (TPR) repeat protein